MKRFKLICVFMAAAMMMASCNSSSGKGKGKGDKLDDGNGKIPVQTTEAEETPTPTPTPEPTDTPTPTPTPAAVVESEYLDNAEVLEIYKGFITEHSEENPDARYLFERVYHNGSIDATQYLLKVFEDGSIKYYRIVRDTNEVEPVFEIAEDFYTYDELMASGDDRLDDLTPLLEYIETYYIADYYQLGTMVFDEGDERNIITVDSGDYATVFFVGSGNNVSVMASTYYNGYSYEEIMQSGVLVQYYAELTYEIDDGSYYGGVQAVSADLSSAWIYPNVGIRWADITETGYDDAGTYYIVCNGNTYTAEDLNDDPEYFIGEYDDDFQNREGYVTCSSDMVLSVRETSTFVSVPFAPDCEVVFSGPWSSVYIIGAEGMNVFSMADDDWQENPYWLEFLAQNGSALTEPVVVENGQIVRIVIGTR